MKFHARLSIFLSVALSTPALAALDVADIFGSHMVLQRDMPVPAWGSAAPGSEVTVSFARQAQRAVADAEGRWKITLDALAASVEPGPMAVSSGAEAIWFEDVLVGEVWLCSGQSNMAFTLAKCEDAEAEIAAAGHPLIRLNGGEDWSVVQEAQAAASADVPNAGYIDIRDQPDGGLHPKNKKPVGERLAAVALEKFSK